MELKEAEKTAQEIAQSPKRPADSMLLIELHKLLIGDKPKKWYCATCTGKMEMVFWDLKLKYFKNLKNTVMAKSSKSTKYQFSAEAKKNGVGEIVLVADGRTEVIRPETLTDKQAERILANEQFAHNIEKIGAATAEPAAKTVSKTAKKGTTAATTAAGAVAGNQEPHTAPDAGANETSESESGIQEK